MSKYIDAEKLIAEIKRYKNKADERLKIKGRTFSEEQKDLALQNLCGNLLHFITSLQLQQEQQEVDLLKALDDYYNKVEFGPEDAIEYETHKSIAHHFYELGLNARKEE